MCRFQVNVKPTQVARTPVLAHSTLPLPIDKLHGESHYQTGRGELMIELKYLAAAGCSRICLAPHPGDVPGTTPGRSLEQACPQHGAGRTLPVSVSVPMTNPTPSVMVPSSPNFPAAAQGSCQAGIQKGTATQWATGWQHPYMAWCEKGDLTHQNACIRNEAMS